MDSTGQATGLRHKVLCISGIGPPVGRGSSPSVRCTRGKCGERSGTAYVFVVSS